MIIWYQWMLGCAKYEFEWDQRTREPQKQILISSIQYQLAGQQSIRAILTVLSMLTFYINIVSECTGGNPSHLSTLYPLWCLTTEFDQQTEGSWWELRKTLSQTSNIRREGGRWEHGGESFPGYSNWEGIRMPLPSLLTPPTPPTTIKKLKPELFFVIQDETM